MPMTPPPLAAEALLAAGRKLLDPFMARFGFAFVPVESGRGTGGPFAIGEYRRGQRRLRFSCRWTLGVVEYRLNEMAVSHDDLMRVTLQPGQRAQYPGFGDDPVDGFRHLLADLDAYGAAFLSGSDDEISARMRASRDAPRPKGLPALDGRTS